ncbi:MAG: hypothetical protein IJP12_00325 [Methanobrevibacter sp.]|nr:hypothetical protein [Methanobrevibacter sp.]
MKSIVFNIDCLLNFLKVKRSDLLQKEFKTIIISNKVYYNLSNPSIPQYIRDDLDSLIEIKFIKIEEININTDVFEIYYEIINNHDKEILGEGEASSIVLAVKHKKALAYNNPDLIKDYLDKYNIKCITTVNILDGLLDKNIISNNEYDDLISELNEY